jgi:hypothetical protein
MCHASWGKWWSHQILTGFLIHAPNFKKRCLWPTDAYLYSHSCEIHRLGPNKFKIYIFLIWTVTRLNLWNRCMLRSYFCSL